MTEHGSIRGESVEEQDVRSAEYDGRSIVIHNWPDLHETDAGRWLRVWEIRLVDPASNDDVAGLGQKLSEAGRDVEFALGDDHTWIEMSVETEEWGWDDPMYFFTYDLFEQVDAAIGPIDTVQGQPRDDWDPWLTRRTRASQEE